MDFLSLMMQCSFLPVTIGATPVVEMELPGILLSAGSGLPCQSGDRLTVEYWIQDETGKEIANSERRGIPYTFELFGPTSDTLLSAGAVGATDGEERCLVLFKEEWYPQVGPFSLIREPGPVLLRIKIARIERR
jgi:hypothetical protein